MVLAAASLALSVGGTLLSLEGQQQSNAARRNRNLRQMAYATQAANAQMQQLSGQADFEAGQSTFDFKGVNLNSGSALNYRENVFNALESDLAQVRKNLSQQLTDISAGGADADKASRTQRLATLISGGSMIAGDLGRFFPSGNKGFQGGLVREGKVGGGVGGGGGSRFSPDFRDNMLTTGG